MIAFNFAYFIPVKEFFLKYRYLKIQLTKVKTIFSLSAHRYHIKYMFVGDMMKNEVETIIRRLRPALQMRLRFIAHINIEEIHGQ